MRHFVKTALVSGLLFVGCGDVGSSSVTSGQDQGQTNTQSQNEPDLNCSITCEVDAADEIVKATKTCEGGAAFAVVLLSQDQCDAFADATDAQATAG